MLKGKKAYICSPLSAPTPEGVNHNMEMAKFYLLRMKAIYHCRTFASHAHLPLMLDDAIPEERETALRIGRELMKLCDVLIICGRHVSKGMENEIKEAFQLGMEVYWYDSIMKPFELMRIEHWRDINDEVQVQRENIPQ